jgi:hypothetical protein
VRRLEALAAAAAAALVLGLGAGAARADQVDDDIAILAKKPGGMSNDAWRARRREAARDLGQKADPRGVDALVKVVESEKFDAVAEIAIEALGKIGDKRAVPVLQKVRDDASRDQGLRDAASEALATLGAAAPSAEAAPGEAAPAPEAPPTEADVGAAAPTEAAPAAGPEDDDASAPAAVTVPPAGRFGPEILAASERWTFAAGALSLAYDSAAKQPQLSGAASLRYHRGLEEPKLGYSFDASVALAGGAEDRNGDLSNTGSYALVGSTVGETELRFYLAGPSGFFLHAAGDLGLGGSAITVESTLGEDFKEFVPSIDAGLALGAGYGRTLDVGAKLRAERVERVLRRARLLGRPINADVANRLETAWWDARDELGFRRALVATIQILKEAGVLLTDPDPTATYEILRVLEDGQLDGRLDGWDARLGVAELVAGRDNVVGDDVFDFHREEVAVARGAFGKQLPGALAEIVGQLRAVYRLGGGSQQYPGYWAAEADVAWRRYFYGDVWDPRGALELGVTVGASDRNTNEGDGDDVGASRAASLRIGYLMIFSRASRLAATTTLRYEGHDVFFGLGLSGSWALSDASYAAW